MSDSPNIKIVADGKTYELDLMDMDGLEARAFREATGVPPSRAFNGDGALDELEVAAGIIWTVRRRTESSLTYDDVLKSLSYKSFTPADGTEEPPDPPA